MSSIESSKTMAMVGSILLILGVVPYGGWVLGIVGVILLLTGIKGFSNYYQDPEMYQNTLKGMIYYIIALVALGASIIALIVGVFSIFFVLVGLAVFIAGLVIAFVFYILAAKRLRMTFNTLAQKTGEHSFETAGYLLWLGAILTIIFVGAILIFVAWIFATIGFISMKLPGQTSGQPPSGYAPPPPPPAAAQPAQAARFCPNCGAPVQPGATFCPSCGKQLPSA
jgi:uncharacterized membrane protein